MDFGQAIRTCFYNCADFKGRARRSEYWWFFLFVVIGHSICAVGDTVLFGGNLFEGTQSRGPSAQTTGLLGIIFSVITALPYAAVACRRLHDTGRSGWFQLLPYTGIGVVLLMVPAMIVSEHKALMITIPIIVGLIVMVGFSILLTIWYATEGDRGSNSYGADPIGPTPKVKSEPA